MCEWIEIMEFEGRYSVNAMGAVRNNLRGTVLKPMLSTSGYLFVHLVMNRKKYTRYIHRLVGEAFIENPFHYPQIDHIDGDKTNNSLTNLRWVSASMNSLAYGRDQRRLNRQKPVKATHISGRQLVFDSRQQAAEYFHCSDTKIKYGHLYLKSGKKGWIFDLA